MILYIAFKFFPWNVFFLALTTSYFLSSSLFLNLSTRSYFLIFDLCRHYVLCLKYHAPPSSAGKLQLILQLSSYFFSLLSLIFQPLFIPTNWNYITLLLSSHSLLTVYCNWFLLTSLLHYIARFWNIKLHFAFVFPKPNQMSSI